MRRRFRENCMDENKNKLIRNSTAEFLMFTTQAGEQSIEARYEDETVWLSQKLMAALFEVNVRTVIGKAIEVVALNGEKAVAGLHTILARRKSTDEVSIGFAA